MSEPQLRLPPHSVEAEQGVLSCVFLDPTNNLDIVESSLNGGVESFYDMRHKEIYEAILAVRAAGMPVSTTTVYQYAKDNNKLAGCGGVAYISEVSDTGASASNVGYFLSILNEKAVLRKVLSACSSAVNRIYERQGDVREFLDSVESEVLSITSMASETKLKPMKEHIRSAISLIQERASGNNPGLMVGNHQFDSMTGGLRAGNMVVIAARPGIGKTSLAMNFGEHVALNNDPVGVFSLEMTAPELVERTVGSHARVNVRRPDIWREQDYKRLHLAANKLAKAPLHIDDTAGLTIGQIRSRARRMKSRHGIKLLIVDYLTLIEGNPRSPRIEQVGEISKGLKGLAKELEIPVIVLAQLNREIEKDSNRKPRMSDLRESGQIEQDGDIIGFLYKTNADHPPDDPTIPVNLFIAKQRNGPVGDVRMTFYREWTRFEETSKIDP